MLYFENHLTNWQKKKLKLFQFQLSLQSTANKVMYEQESMIIKYGSRHWLYYFITSKCLAAVRSTWRHQGLPPPLRHPLIIICTHPPI